MAILRSALFPTVGVPQEISLRPKKNMLDEEFYQQQQEQAGQRQQFLQNPVTGDYIKEQIERIKARSAPPKLEPGSRVVAANKQTYDPSNFQKFYDRLSTISNISQASVQTAQAQAAYKRQQQLQATLTAPVSGGGRSGGNDYGSGIPSNPKANFRFAESVAPNFGWGANELSAWYTLGTKESGWNNLAQNPTSTAFGIGQFLNSTWAGVGGRKTSDAATQVQYMAQYIKNRYGTPSRALAFHKANNWY